MRRLLWDLGAVLVGWCVGTILPPAVQRLTVEVVVLLGALAVLTHVCGRVLRLLFPALAFPRALVPPAVRIRAGTRRPTAAERRLRAWLARTRPPDTGPPRHGRRHQTSAPRHRHERPP